MSKLAALFHRSKSPQGGFNLALVLVLWLAVANASYAVHGLISWAITLGFVFIVPGLLVLYLLKLERLRPADKAGLSIGLSLLSLMVTGLVINGLGVFGVSRPLSSLNIFLGVDAMSLLLMTLSFRQLRATQFRLPTIQVTRREIMIIILDILMPVLAIMGAVRLNNSASNVLTMTLFGLIPIVFFWLVWSKDINRVRLMSLFSMALAVLFSTSLRGWYVTGHDIQQEFAVFQLAFRNEHWSVAADRSPYNACLSITILPVMLAKLTAINSIYIYKIVFQIVFASIVIPIYRFLKRFGDVFENGLLPLLGTFMFISFITFMSDMPFLNRQEIAFIFFVLILFVGFALDVPKKAKTILLLLMLTGLVISHYSTNYVAFALFIIAALLYQLLRVTVLRDKAIVTPKLFDFRILLAAGVLTFLWNAQITNTSANLSITIENTVRNVIHHNGAKSPDVSSTLFGGGEPNSHQLLSEYLQNYYGNVNNIQLQPAPVLPLTAFGNFLHKHLPVVITLNTVAKNLGSKLLQVLLLIGAGVITMRSIRKDHSEPMLAIVALTGATLILLGAITLLPTLSVSYGALRLFQQAIPILCIPILIGFSALLPFNKRILSASFALVIIFIYCEASGFIPQLIGGYAPLLSLNNAGQYYDAYYVHGSELTAAAWAKSALEHPSNVYMDYFAQIRFGSSNQLTAKPLLSGDPGSYIFLDSANQSTGEYEIYSNGYVLWYTLSSGIEQLPIYTNGSSTIYGK